MWRKTLVTFALNLAVAGYGWLPSQSALPQDAQIRISSAVVNVPVAVYDKKPGVVYLRRMPECDEAKANPV
jgi:hypothetical protein